MDEITKIGIRIYPKKGNVYIEQVQIDTNKDLEPQINKWIKSFSKEILGWEYEWEELYL